MTVAPVRKLAPKALPRAHATTVLALRGMSARDDVVLMKEVADLIQWGTRPKLIQRLTGAGNGMSLRRMCNRESPGNGAGRPTENIGHFMEAPALHLEASYFLTCFIAFQAQEGATSILNEAAFVGAYRTYRGSVMRLRPGLPGLTPDNAFLIATQYVSKDCTLGRCSCSVHFLQSREPVKVYKSMRCGACPNCTLNEQRRRKPRHRDASAHQLTASSNDVAEHLVRLT